MQLRILVVYKHARHGHDIERMLNEMNYWSIYRTSDLRDAEILNEFNDRPFDVLVISQALLRKAGKIKIKNIYSYNDANNLYRNYFFDLPELYHRNGTLEYADLEQFMKNIKH